MHTMIRTLDGRPGRCVSAAVLGAVLAVRCVQFDAARKTRTRLRPSNDCMQTPRTTWPAAATTGHQDARARRGPRRGHPAGTAGHAGPGVRAVPHRRTRGGAGHARPIHQAATVEPGAGLRACTCAAWSTSTTTWASSAAWRGRTWPNATSRPRATPTRRSGNWSTQFPQSRYADGCPRCGWTTSSTRWPTTKCTWRATTSAAAPILAAANRAQQHVTEFPQTPANRDALLHHDVELRTPRPRSVARRRRARAEAELPDQPGSALEAPRRTLRAWW